MTIEKNRSSERTPDTVLLVVETSRGDSAEEIALRRTVGDALGLDAKGRPWHVERLFGGAVPEAGGLDRYFRVTGSIDAPPRLLEQAAFELAYRLSEATHLHVEPDLPSSSFEPPELEHTKMAGVEEAAHLPGSEPYDWALKAIRCPEDREIPPPSGGASGKGVVIAHPDTGYADHPDTGLDAFDLRLDWDVLDDDDDALDPLDTWASRPFANPGHGTSTASVIAARPVTRIRGVAPDATVVPLRAIKSVVQVHDSDVARAINHARRIGAHVVSMSLGGLGFRGLREVIEHAVGEGMIVLAAAGNYARFVVAPASYPDCIAVAATNADDRPWSGSSRGAKVAVSAPGESVWVAAYGFQAPSGRHSYLDRRHGTSFAVAHTAGAAALWLSHHGRDALIERYGKSRLQAAFLHLLTSHGHRQPQDWDSRNFGVGILDIQALLEAPLPESTDVEPTLEPAALEAASAPQVGERVAALFPDLIPGQVEERLAALLGVSGDALAEKLERYEAELAWIFSEQPSAWDAFMAATTEEAPSEVAAEAAPCAETPRAGATLAGPVARLGSPTLSRALVGGPRP